VGGDEPDEEPVEERRGILEHRAEAIRRERPTAGDGAQLREERAAGRDEQPDGLGQAQARGRETAAQVLGEGFGPGFRGRAGGVVIGVQVGDERRDEPRPSVRNASRWAAGTAARMSSSGPAES
jgi:hypothetical protein